MKIALQKKKLLFSVLPMIFICAIASIYIYMSYYRNYLPRPIFGTDVEHTHAGEISRLSDVSGYHLNSDSSSSYLQNNSIDEIIRTLPSDLNNGKEILVTTYFSIIDFESKISSIIESMKANIIDSSEDLELKSKILGKEFSLPIESKTKLDKLEKLSITELERLIKFRFLNEFNESEMLELIEINNDVVWSTVAEREEYFLSQLGQKEFGEYIAPTEFSDQNDKRELFINQIIKSTQLTNDVMKNAERMNKESKDVPKEYYDHLVRKFLYFVTDNLTEEDYFRYLELVKNEVLKKENDVITNELINILNGEKNH